MMLISGHNITRDRHRSCRRLRRNCGWWEMVWRTYDDDCFKRTFRVSKKTFQFILSRIHHTLKRQTLCEEPISPAFRLGLSLYRLGRGDYFYTIAEMVGLAPCTVSTIVHEVNETIVSCLWECCITIHMPKTEEDFKKKMLDMEELWQFPFSWCAVDGCHIPIKCPLEVRSHARSTIISRTFFQLFSCLWLMPDTGSYGGVVVTLETPMTLSFCNQLLYGQT